MKNSICIFLIFFFSSCSKSVEKETQLDYSEIFEEMVRVSKNSSQNEYRTVYKLANDSVTHWINNNLSAFYTEKVNKWKIDPLICFNQKGDKCLMALLKSNTLYKDQTADGITYFYGIKIENRLYFFKGPYLALPREVDKKHIPRSFPQLHEIAIKEVFRGHLKKNKETGEWEINEKFFSYLTSNAFNGENKPYTQAQWDSVYLEISNPWKWGKVK